MPKAFELTEKQVANFWLKVEKSEGCWLWTGARTVNKGFHYGVFRLRYDGLVKAHRVAFQLSGGILDPALTIDHLCQNKLCCRADHMEQVTAAENTRRLYQRRPELRAASEEERKIRNREAQQRWREKNPERAKEQKRRYYLSKGKTVLDAKWQAFKSEYHRLEHEGNMEREGRESEYVS